MRRDPTELNTRWPFCIGVPSLYHFTRGVGFPLALHGSTANVPLFNVWFDGPIWIIGGGESSTDVTYRRIDRHVCINIRVRKRQMYTTIIMHTNEVFNYWNVILWNRGNNDVMVGGRWKPADGIVFRIPLESKTIHVYVCEGLIFIKAPGSQRLL